MNRLSAIPLLFLGAVGCAGEPWQVWPTPSGVVLLLIVLAGVVLLRTDPARHQPGGDRAGGSR